jgi:hypothetical protein
MHLAQHEAKGTPFYTRKKGEHGIARVGTLGWWHCLTQARPPMPAPQLSVLCPYCEWRSNQKKLSVLKITYKMHLTNNGGGHGKTKPCQGGTEQSRREESDRVTKDWFPNALRIN